MKTLLRIFVPVVAVIIAIVGMLAFKQASPNNYSADTDLVKTFTLNEPGHLEVTTSGGKIEVNGHNDNQVTIKAIVRKNGRVLDESDSALDDVLQQYDLRMEKNGNQIVAYAKRKSKGSFWKNTGIGFEVDVPSEMSNDLKTSGGGIKLTGVKGTHELNTSGGGLTLEDIDGPVDGTTSGGGIRVKDQKGDLDLSTSGGSINIEDATGNIDASTSGGGITLEDISGDVDVSSSGGRIRVDGRAPSIKATTSGGGIHANVTGVEESVYLRTSGGSIHAVIDGGKGMDLDLSGNSVSVDLNNFSGSHKKNKVTGTMNGGGIQVYMHTSGGRVECEFR